MILKVCQLCLNNVVIATAGRVIATDRLVTLLSLLEALQLQPPLFEQPARIRVNRSKAAPASSAKSFFLMDVSLRQSRAVHEVHCFMNNPFRI